MNVESGGAAFANPFKPGAGHMPPHLAGREAEKEEFERLLGQDTILENLILTGLRGVGKTVLLEAFKPLAIREGWLWVGTDLSEAASVSEQTLALRLMTDLSVVTSGMVVGRGRSAGFAGESSEVTLDFPLLVEVYENAPGLVADKIKAVLELAASVIADEGKRGVLFAYDEAQTLADAPPENEFPLSMLLDVFQSIQKKDIPFMLVLTGLPTLFPKLVEARTFSERMFRVLVLDKLNRDDSMEAILKPIQAASCPVRFTEESVGTICDESGGYPYFIQFICREVYDAFIQQIEKDGGTQPVPMESITRKLDSDFFAGRWARATDRQRELLWVIASLGKQEEEFTVQEVLEESSSLPKPFSSSSHVNQMLATLCDAGLIYKNRWGKYSFAVPLFDRFILRQSADQAISA
jgi:hypothetical protein